MIILYEEGKMIKYRFLSSLKFDLYFSYMALDSTSEKNMRSKNPIYEEDPEETTINKTVEITNPDFIGIELTGMPWNMYTYQTGILLVTSRKGTKYVFVLCCYNSNPTITEPLKDSTRK